MISLIVQCEHLDIFDTVIKSCDHAPVKLHARVIHVLSPIITRRAHEWPKVLLPPLVENNLKSF